MRTPNDIVLPAIPPIPAPPAGARSLVLDVAGTQRILFALGGRIPSDRQRFGMNRHIEAEFRRYWTEYGLQVAARDLRWRWVR